MEHRLQLQLPRFLLNNEPTAVPGGGAEVVPAGNEAWFANHGFSPSFAQSSSFLPVSQAQPDYDSQPESQSAPFDFDIPPSSQFQPPIQASDPDLSIFLASRQPWPVYSSTGFDILSILARVATRPNPQIVLGPVDLTCSFVVVDVRRFDHPIVYCSPSFCTLTGYSESEVIGRNCRFLQAPGGDVRKGSPRVHTSSSAVSLLRKSSVAGKECQIKIPNYRKDGSRFENLVTVIPLPGGESGLPYEENECVYQIGFQVDIDRRPDAILYRTPEGNDVIAYANHQGSQDARSSSTRERKAPSIPHLAVSKDLKRLVADPAFVRSLPLSTSTTVLPPAPSASVASQEDNGSGSSNQLLHLLLLEASPDFIHVVSLKGDFLYVAPSVRRVLGYEPDELVNKKIEHFAHPEDVVPLMRELKECSATGTTAGAEGSSNPKVTSPVVPRSVDLLFRARTKLGRYVWIESRGRLYVEPGKGRKAIILSGRSREMASLRWEDVKLAGGIAKALRAPVGTTKGKDAARFVEQEVWGMMAGHGKESMSFLSVGNGIEDVLGWSSDDLIGQGVTNIMADQAAVGVLAGVVANMRSTPTSPQRTLESPRMKKIRCSLRKKNSGIADVWFIIYRSDARESDAATSSRESAAVKTGKGGLSVSPSPLVYQIRLFDAETFLPPSTSSFPPSKQSPSSSDQTASSEPTSSFTVPAPVSQDSAPEEASSFPLPGPPSLEVFEELAISKGSSWHYELERLRKANTMLRDELAALEVANAGALALCSDSARESTPSRYPEGLLSPKEPVVQKASHLSIYKSEALAPFQNRYPPSYSSYESDYPQQQSVYSAQYTAAHRSPVQPPPSHILHSWDPVPVATNIVVPRKGVPLKRPWTMQS